MNFTTPVNYKIQSLPRKNAPRAGETKMAVHPFLVKFVILHDQKHNIGAYNLYILKKKDPPQKFQPKTEILKKKEFADADGTKYYYNAKTGLSQWERPREWDQMERNERERVEREEKRAERAERQRQEKVAAAAREDEMKKPPMPGIEGWEVSKTLDVFF